MPDFRFDDSKNFNENCKAFLEAVKALDPEMADILGKKWQSLVAIVREGQRDSKARGDLNADIGAALDSIVSSAGPKGGT